MTSFDTLQNLQSLLKDHIEQPIFIAYAALVLMALIPIYFGSFAALEEIKVSIYNTNYINTNNSFYRRRKVKLSAVPMLTCFQ